MTVPVDARSQIEQAIEDAGLGSRIATTQPVGGGCINHGARIETDRGRSLFLKWNAHAPPGMFAAEAAGLDAMRGKSGLRVPEPIAWGEAADAAWLVMEHIESGRAGPTSWSQMGSGLAALHSGARGDAFGWDRDNWIGSLPQVNTPGSEWGAFWRDVRIGPQLSASRRSGYLDDEVMDRLLDLIPSALADVTTPSLVHGDLWSGNAYFDAEGKPVVIDPAVYRGDGEVDLAMSELFGGFPAAFYHAYDEARGISAAYRAYRKDLYQLYYLLVHVNLFGGSYVNGSRRATERVIAELG